MDDVYGWVYPEEKFPVWMPEPAGVGRPVARFSRETAERIRRAFAEFAACQKILYEASTAETLRGGAEDERIWLDFEDSARAVETWPAVGK